MPYCIPCSTKTRTLAIAPFFFIVIGVICEFAIFSHVYIILFPQEEEVHFPSKKLRKICEKKSNLNFIRVIKSASFDQTFSVYMVQTFLKSLWWQFLVSCSEHPFYRVRHDYFNFFNVSILWYTNNVFLRSLSLAHFSAQFINQAFKCFWQ